MAARFPGKELTNKLHAVSLIRSGIRQPYWEKRTLKALGLTKLHKTVIHKNTATVNGLLKSVKHLIDVKPVTVFTDSKPKPNRVGEELVFLRANGQFDMKKYQQFVNDNPKLKKTLDKSRNPMQQIFFKFGRK